MRKIALGLAFAGFTAAALAAEVADNDPNYWLTDIWGAKQLTWVKQQNAKSEGILKSDPYYAETRVALLKSLDIKDRIPLGHVDHGKLYNFWQDASHVRGLWRRVSMAEYRKADPKWEVLLDVDKLDADQHKDWVFQGAQCTPSDARCLVRLSPGGGDASEVREFDPKTHQLLADGFTLPAAKSSANYVDENTILFATDFGPGTMTKSSYPRILKMWRRGEKQVDAKQVFEVGPGDIAVREVVYHGPGGLTNKDATVLVERGVTFFQNEYHFMHENGATTKLPLPLGANLQGMIKGNLILTLREDWKVGNDVFKRGSLVAFSLADFLKNPAAPNVSLLFAPDDRTTIGDVSAGRDAVYASVYHDVTGAVHVFKPGSGRWSDVTLDLPKGGSTAVVSADDWGPEALFTYESFLTPPTLYEDTGNGKVAAIKSQAPLFDAKDMVSEQFWATSADGTKVPYFLIHRKQDTKDVPTILYSYGGFELSLNPWYWNDGHRPLDAGQVWISRGGAVAVANIRGGGEFGPRWHQAALKEHRQRAFDDFAAVGTDLEARGFTTPQHLGIVGASNGGVLTTVTMTQQPQMLNAVVSQRPLVDMLRYTRFGAGASWVAEYGDPDKPEDRAYIEKYSAYQNVKPDVKYPGILFITETSDDRVTPIWARMMAAKMEDQGHDVLFNESSEGGHGPGATSEAQAEMWGLTYAFFAQKLGLGVKH
ncbi:MAG TPA: prolyl oligopeptidase family serine peptidase [Rhizomicrobium sp.]|nr:prolyl oligopeptidase family serine peptidase [Rhizomicrobium sp.]